MNFEDFIANVLSSYEEYSRIPAKEFDGAFLFENLLGDYLPNFGTALASTGGGLDSVEAGGDFNFVDDDVFHLTGELGFGNDLVIYQYRFSLLIKGFSRATERKDLTKATFEFDVSKWLVTNLEPTPDGEGDSNGETNEDSTTGTGDSETTGGTTESDTGDSSDTTVDGGETNDPVVSDSDTQTPIDQSQIIAVNNLNSDVLNQAGIISNRVNVILFGRFGQTSLGDGSILGNSISYTTSEMQKIKDSFGSLDEIDRLKMLESFNRYRLGMNTFFSLSKNKIQKPDIDISEEINEWKKKHLVEDYDFSAWEKTFDRRAFANMLRGYNLNRSNNYEWIPYRYRRIANDIHTKNILAIIDELCGDFPKEETCFFAVGIPDNGQPEIDLGINDETANTEITSRAQKANSSNTVMISQKFKPWSIPISSGYGALPINKSFCLDIYIDPISIAKIDFSNRSIEKIVADGAKFRIFDHSTLKFSEPMGFKDIQNSYSEFLEDSLVSANSAENWINVFSNPELLVSNIADSVEEYASRLKRAKSNWLIELCKNELINYAIREYVNMYSGYDISEANFPLEQDQIIDKPSQETKEVFGIDDNNETNRLLISPAANPSGYIKKLISPKIFDRIYYLKMNINDLDFMAPPGATLLEEIAEKTVENQLFELWKIPGGKSTLLDNLIGKSHFDLTKFEYPTVEEQDVVVEEQTVIIGSPTPSNPVNENAEEIAEAKAAYELPNVVITITPKSSATVDHDKILAGNYPEDLAQPTQWKNIEYVVSIGIDRELNELDKLKPVILLMNSVMDADLDIDYPNVMLPQINLKNISRGEYTIRDSSLYQVSLQTTIQLSDFWQPHIQTVKQKQLMIDFRNEVQNKKSALSNSYYDLFALVVDGQFSADDSISDYLATDKLEVDILISSSQGVNQGDEFSATTNNTNTSPEYSVFLGTNSYGISLETRNAIINDIEKMVSAINAQMERRDVVEDINAPSSVTFGVQTRARENQDAIGYSYDTAELHEARQTKYYQLKVLSGNSVVGRRFFEDQWRYNGDLSRIKRFNLNNNDLTKTEGFLDWFDRLKSTIDNLDLPSPNDGVTTDAHRKSQYFDKQIYFYNNRILNDLSTYYYHSRIPQLQRIVHFYSICAAIVLRTKAKIKERLKNDDASSEIIIPSATLLNIPQFYSGLDSHPFHKYHQDEIYSTTNPESYPNGLQKIKDICRYVDDENGNLTEAQITYTPNANWRTNVGSSSETGDGWRNYAYAWRSFLRDWMKDLEYSLEGFDVGDEMFLDGSTFNSILNDIK